METIVGSFPIQDTHLEQQQERWIVNLHPINHMKPFGPTNHMCPQPIIEEKVWEDVIPPLMVCSRRILPLLDNPMEGVLGDLIESPSVFLQTETKREITL